MPITKDEALWLYRCVLDREPESEAALALTVENSISFRDARRAMLASPEFQSQFSPPPIYKSTNAAPPIRHPILCVAAIMKNEAPLVATMLRSIAPIADFVVLHDTGSTDDTKKVAIDTIDELGLQGHVYDAAFYDFANARNAVVDTIPSFVDWILMMDCDEHLVPEDYQLLLDLIKIDCIGWRLPRYNFLDAEKHRAPIAYPDFRARLFKRMAVPAVRYAGAVHETPIGSTSWRAAPINTTNCGGERGGPHIHHMGHVVRSSHEYDAKIEWYTELASVRSKS